MSDFGGTVGPKRSSAGPTVLIAALIGGVLLVGLAVIVSMAAFWVMVDVPQPVGPNATRHPGVGKMLSQLELQPLTGDGQPIALDDLEDQVVLLNFWGTWCAPCLAELPDVAQIEKKYRHQLDFRFLAVSCGQDEEEDLQQLKLSTTALLFEKHLDMPTYADPGAVTRLAVDEAAGFKGYPTTLVLDRRGTIRGVWRGVATKDQLDRLITELLEESL